MGGGGATPEKTKFGDLLIAGRPSGRGKSEAGGGANEKKMKKRNLHGGRRTGTHFRKPQTKRTNQK